MINFIIYEDNKHWQDQYKKIILNVIGRKKDKYHIFIFDKYDQEVKKKISSLIGKNIFLLDVEVPGKSGLDLAKEIRNNEDWMSQMIMVTSHQELKEKGLTSKLLLLDFIVKRNNILKRIEDSLILALRIHSHYKSFNFMYNHEFYQIPYQDILYFEKDLNNNYTSIFTKTNMYKIKQSIKSIELKLKNVPSFFKTHQSCIINLKNVKHVDFSKNNIHFFNCKIDLLSRTKKKELKERIEKDEIFEIL